MRTLVAGLREAFEKEVVCGSMRAWGNKINRDLFLVCCTRTVGLTWNR